MAHNEGLTDQDQGLMRRDKVESTLHAEVCASRMSLAQARKQLMGWAGATHSLPVPGEVGNEVIMTIQFLKAIKKNGKIRPG